MRIYLDACCLNRPFDDQSQNRIRIESEAVRLILDLCSRGLHEWITSDAIRDEISRNPDSERRSLIIALLDGANDDASIDHKILEIAQSFISQGLKSYDALHLALAENSSCDILLTTDDTFIRRAARLQPRPRVRVENPASWLDEAVEQ